MIKETVEYVVFYFLRIIFFLLPERFISFFLKLLLIIVKFFLYHRQKIMIRNLHMSFPEISPEDIIKISNSVWYNIGLTFILSFKYIAEPNKILRKTKFKDPEKLKQISPNTIIFTAHIGNWEILAQRLVLEGYKVAAIVRELRNKIINLQVTKVREKLGGKVFYPHQLNFIIKWLKNGGIIYLLPDQHIAEGSVVVDFLGRKAFTTPIITLLNKRLKSKILPMFCIKEDNGIYTIYIEDPYIPLYTGDLRKDLEYNTLNINKIIEKYILKYPEQWMWLHKRWKER
ncbi:MAG: lysophospholipid acyltransferase family protein [Endomicrobiia bacterium]